MTTDDKELLGRLRMTTDGYRWLEMTRDAWND